MAKQKSQRRVMAEVLLCGAKTLRSEFEQRLTEARRQKPVPYARIATLEREIEGCKKNEKINKIELMRAIAEEVDSSIE